MLEYYRMRWVEHEVRKGRNADVYNDLLASKNIYIYIYGTMILKRVKNYNGLVCIKLSNISWLFLIL
jgi:hypothetical protein